MAVNEVVIALGSNIRPAENIARARASLRRDYTFVDETAAVCTRPRLFTRQADFFNCAVLIQTPLTADVLKERLRAVESELGRVRAGHKDGPRTIDLDIVVWNGRVVDEHVYEWDFLRRAVQELLPELDLSRPDPPHGGG